MLKVAVGFPEADIHSLEEALDAGFEFRIPEAEISPDVIKACTLDFE
jgi:hypothetical protein